MPDMSAASVSSDLASRALFPHRHLLSIADLKPWEIRFLLDEAEHWAQANKGQARKHDGRLAGMTQINAFFENSTRTLLSFEIAGKRLGADVVNMAAATSSVKKGETLIDTAMTLNAMAADVIVIRHASSGAVALIADKVDCPVLNAGDGRHEHPTQALLDALTIRRRLGGIANKRVVICGDLLHSRVARSNILALTALAAEVRVCAPSTLMPPAIERFGVTPFTDFDRAMEGADVVMMLRLQTERMAGGYVPSVREYHLRYGLTLDRLERDYGSPMARALYCSVDAAAYRPVPGPKRWDLTYLGTYSADRQPTLERLLIEPARHMPDKRFCVAGPQYPDDIDWPANVERIDHLPPADHAAFYCASRYTLNVTRADMIAAGWSPSVRLFEAAACGTPIISDIWPGLSDLLAPNREILLADKPEQICVWLHEDRSAVGTAARARILAEHTADARAAQLEQHLQAAIAQSGADRVIAAE